MTLNQFHTVVPSLQLPALPSAQGAMSLAVQYQLEKSQWWSAEKLQDQQCTQLALLLRHAVKNVPFYRSRFQQAGVEIYNNVTPELILQIPILKRAELQQSGKAINANDIPKPHGKTHLIQTSGSTGRPVSLLGTDLTRFFWGAFTLRDHHWHRRDLSKNLAAIRWTKKGLAMPPAGLQRKGWGASTDSAYVTGSSMMLNSASNISEQMTWLEKYAPHYLVSYPSNLQALARYSLENKKILKNLREITTVGEVVTQKTRLACRQAWGVPVVDFYTCQEAGYLALQCPDHEHYHVQSENIYLEVVDDQGQPCKPGEIGRVLITSLNNFASPLIRYELGDYAELGSLCSCGRGLPVLKRVLGRVRNMLILPNGEQRWPNLGYRALEEITPIQQFQLVQHSLETLELKLVVPAPLGEVKENALRHILIDHLGHSFRIEITYPKEIQRSSNGKFEDFLSKIH